MIQHTNTRSCVGWSGHLPSLRGLVFVRGCDANLLQWPGANKDVSPQPWRDRDRRCYGYSLTPVDGLCVSVAQHDKSTVHLCLSHLGRSLGCLSCAACISLSTTIDPNPTLTNSLRSISVSSCVAVSVVWCAACHIPRLRLRSSQKVCPFQNVPLDLMGQSEVAKTSISSSIIPGLPATQATCLVRPATVSNIPDAVRACEGMPVVDHRPPTATLSTSDNAI